jgi:broad specificity phosphatase PhoE
MKEIWFIRHGESIGNAGHPTPGVVENPLSERGHIQAEAIADRISCKPQLIVVSPYLRTRQTAHPTIQRYPDVPVETWQVQEYTILAAARYVGTTEAERMPWGEAIRERNDPDHFDGEGADSFRGLLARLATLKTQCETLPHAYTLIFSHGRFIRMLLWYLLQGAPQATPERMREAFAYIQGTRLENGVIVRALIDEQGRWLVGRM